MAQDYGRDCTVVARIAYGADVVAAIEHSAMPHAVSVAVERMVEADPPLAALLDTDASLRAALVAVLGASRSLTQLCVTDPAALSVLAALDRPVVEDDLARWQRLEYLRIAALDLTGQFTLDAVGRALADMADGVFERAFSMITDAEDLAVIGMGKYGGRELNYASDVDVLFVGADDARPILALARRCFRVDVDLRPEGRDGPLVRTLDAFMAYWARWAATWEFQALLKQRPAAGSPALLVAFDEAARRALWERQFGAEELREVRAMKVRAEGEVQRRGLTERELKRGRGGIRDIEFAVQLLQLVHGRADPSLRSPTTLVALAELAAAGYVAPDDAVVFADAYRFLRTVEHRLQLWDGGQVHAIPARGEALERLARVCGYRPTADADAVSSFLADLRHHQAAARTIHERLFFRPLLESFSGATMSSAMSAAAVASRLSAFGFTSATRTRQALTELTRGLTRASRLMQQVLPLLLEWLSESPDPDDGLLGLRTMATGQHRTDQLVQMFRDAPEGAQRLCLILGSSRLVTGGLQRHPSLVGDLADPSRFDGPAIDIDSALRWRPATERLDALRRLKDYEETRIQIRDLLGPPGSVGPSLTRLAETVLAEALEIARSTTQIDLPVAVIAMGRFGGGELSYASDLDVMIVHAGHSDAEAAAAEELASTLGVFVNGSTPATRLYPLDFDLRPEGRQGPLARSLAGYAQYYDRWAQTWERQALLRGRVVVGSASLGAAFADLATSFLARPVTPDDEREIRRVKARIERERIPPGDDPDFHLKLGRGGLSDVEWTVQLLQLRHRVFDAAGTMDALAALEAAGHVSSEDAATLRAAYVYGERARDRLYLVRGAPGDALPRSPEQLGKLARSLGTSGPALREEYRRVTRRAREVTERLFYDRPPAGT
ncbi:MAG: bifunctional [glutamine synthetase] adenylyltransferase/[glutamine synthetase]-adenylyl-L-tyrosine phosphorylase [Acidimicrobiales bacterium]